MSYCKARSTSGFYCCLRTHEPHQPHLSFDNTQLDERGLPGKRIEWPGDGVPLRVGFTVHPDEFGGSDLPPSPSAAKVRRQISQAQGYTGDPCGHCGSLLLKRSGSCLVCDGCGTTTGCS